MVNSFTPQNAEQGDGERRLGRTGCAAECPWRPALRALGVDQLVVPIFGEPSRVPWTLAQLRETNVLEVSNLFDSPPALNARVSFSRRAPWASAEEMDGGPVARSETAV